MENNIFNRAIEYALNVHDGVKRKSADIPFILHPMEVATIVSTITENLDVIAAAFLHDTVEDGDVSLEEIKEIFNEEVMELVKSETENKRRDILPEETWQIRKEESLEVLKNSKNINVKILWLADKLSNLRSFYRLYLEKGDKMWQAFHQSDPSKQEWYFRKVYEYTHELKDEAAYKEYGELLDKLFGGK